MRISVGIDIAKEVHWVTAIDHDGVVAIDRKLENTPAAIASLIDELKQLGGTVRIGLDVVVQRTPAKRMFAASELPSASLLIRDILFRTLGAGWNPQNAGLRSYLSEPPAPARKPILGRFPSLPGPFL